MTTSNPQAFLTQSAAYDLVLKTNFDNGVKVGFNKINWLTSMGLMKVKNTAGGRIFRFLRRHLEDASQVRAFVDGTTINGVPFGFSEGTIQCNDLIDAVAYEMGKSQINLADFDFMTGKGEDLGYAVSRQMHLRGMNILIQAARSSASTRTVDGRSITFHNGGQRVTNTGTLATRYSVNAAGAENIRTDLENLAQLFDEDDIPRDEGGNVALISPREHRVLLQDTKIFDIQYGQNANDNNYNNRIIGKVAGFNIMVVNDLPRTNYVDNDVSAYNLNSSSTSPGVTPGIIAVRGAGIRDLYPIGAVVAQGLSSIVTPMDEKTNVVTMKAEMHYGIGVMHPEVAGVIDFTN
jgi:hypothetical protein